MKKLTAILISNAATNEIYLPNNTSIMVTKTVLKDFLAAKDFSDWNGENTYKGTLDDIFLENQDDVIAFSKEGTLVADETKIKELKELLGENLQMQYNEWAAMQEGFEASTDCGERAAKEDFEAHIGASIEFEEMLELERYYNRYVK